MVGGPKLPGQPTPQIIDIASLQIEWQGDAKSEWRRLSPRIQPPYTST